MHCCIDLFFGGVFGVWRIIYIFGVRCLLCVVCCFVVSVVRCSLLVACCLLYVDWCYILVIVRCALWLVCGLLSVVPSLLSDV